MSRLSERELSERFNDTEGMLRALRRAAEFARLRREMWERFRASIAAEEGAKEGAEEGNRNGPGGAASPHGGAGDRP